MAPLRSHNGVPFEVRWADRHTTQVVAHLHDCEVVITIVDNAIREVLFVGESVRAKHLKTVRLEGLVQEALSHSTIEEVRPDGEIVRRVRTRPTGQGRRGAERSRPRTTMTPSRLREVVEAYNRGGIPAVREALSVSESTAKRYVAQARNAGHDLPRRKNGRPPRQSGGVDNQAT